MSSSYANTTSANHRAGVLLLSSCLCVSIMVVLAKDVSSVASTEQMTLFRFVFALLVLLVLNKGKVLVLTRSGMLLHQVLRALLGVFASWCGYYSVAHIALSEATAITFSRGLWLFALGMIFFHDRFSMSRLVSVFICIAGVYLIVRPDFSDLNPAYGVALFGTMLVAVVVVYTKYISAVDDPRISLFYFSLIAAVAMLPPAMLNWQPLDEVAVAKLSLMSAFGVAGQYLSIHAYRLGNVTKISSLDYTRLLFAMISGAWFFQESFSFDDFAGAGLILSSIVFTLSINLIRR